MLLSVIHWHGPSRRALAVLGVALIVAISAVWLFGGGPRNGGASNGVTVKGHYIPIDPLGKLYVTDNTQTTNGVTTPGNSVTIYDEKTNDVVSTVSVGRGPKGIDVHFQKDCADRAVAQNYFYVANSLDNTLSAVKDFTDVTKDVVAWTNPTGASPWGVAVDHCYPAVLVTNNAGNSVTVVDGDENQVFGTITLPAGARPQGIAVDQASHRAYVANSGNGTVSVIDIPRLRVTATIAVAGSPVSAAADNKGHVFVASTNGTGNGTLTAINVSNNTANPLATTTGPSPFYVAANPVNNQVYVTNNGNNTLSQYTYNGTTNAFTNAGTVNLPPDPKGVNFTSDGTSAYIAEQSSGTITQVDSSGARTATDRTAPTSTINNLSPYHPGGTLTGTSTDDASGVGSVAVGFTAAGSTTPPTTTVNATLSCSDNRNLSCTWSTPLPADGRYKAWVRGSDRNSDTAGPNLEAWVTADNVLIDGTPPASSINNQSPYHPGSTLTGGSADPGTGVTSVAVGFTAAGSTTPPAATSNATLTCNAGATTCTWSTPLPVADGRYKAWVRGTDGNGNVETWVTADNIAIDGTAPVSTITNPASDFSVLLPGDTVRGNATDNVSGVASVVVTYTPQALGAPTTVTATLTCNADATSCTWASTVPSLSPGVYQIQSKATDKAGNAETPGPGRTVQIGGLG